MAEKNCFSMKRRNPFRKSYLGIGLVCCIALSIIFLCVNYTEIQTIQRINNQKKAELMLQDFETQMQLMEEIALRISVDSKYQLHELKEDKYNEVILLQDFVLYEQYSTLPREYFLYYGGSNIFHSSGTTRKLTYYLREMPAASDQLQAQLEQILEDGSNTWRQQKLLPVSGDIYVLTPLSVLDGSEKAKAVLCFVIGSERLKSRFHMVSAGMDGTVCLYEGETLFYCNQEQACGREQRNVLTATSADGKYTLSYLPERESDLYTFRILEHVLLFLMAWFFVLVVGNLFAEKAYRPIERISEKYRTKIALSEESECENALEEINNMLESCLQSNVRANMQITQKQKMLKKQILRMIAEERTSFDIQPYLESLQIRLPGPYFFVIIISFRKEERVNEVFLNRLQDELEQSTCEEDGVYVYAVCDLAEKRISVICSVPEEDEKEAVTEMICDLAESFEYKPLIGKGNVYRTISRLSVSCLEGMDIIRGKENQLNSGMNSQFIYDMEDLHYISSALSKADEAEALEGLNRFLEQLNKESVSFLMQQYIYADFLNTIVRLAKKQRIELSGQSINLIISAKNQEHFKDAARELIHQFCESMLKLKNHLEEEEAFRIYEYVNTHFAEYDITIERIATDLNTTTAAVRQAIFERTGKMYKDYLIFLRIEEAKKLLLRDDMTADEVCQKVGYISISYFTRLFKRETGVTPAKYKHRE